ALKGAAKIFATLFPLFFSTAGPAADPESSITFASVSPSRSMVDAVHIADTPRIRVKAITKAIIVRLRMALDSFLHFIQNVHQVEGGGAENCDKKRGKQKTCERKQKLDGRFLSFLLGALTSFRPQ